jgi:uncharacterized protein YllA (UPF0747 family)
VIRIEHLPADLFGLSELQRAALSGQLISSGVARRSSEIALPPDPYLPAERAHLSRWLESQATAQSPPVAVLDSIRALADPGVSCVVTCARPALLLGPATVLWRALQAIALARQLTDVWGMRVIPVLWNHADEHDAAGLAVASVLNRHFDLQEVGLESVSRNNMPLHEVPLGSNSHGLGALRAVLSQLYGDLPHVQRALEIFVPREGESLPSAFTRALHELLGGQGLVVVEPQVLGEEAAHALAQLVGADVGGALETSLKTLPAAQREALGDLPTAAQIYCVDARGRRPLYPGGDGYRYEDEPGSRTSTELAAELVQEPRSWSAGEVLRPLVRDQLLPVAACVGDEEELAQHLWLGPARRALGLPAPAFVPSLRATWLDGELSYSLTRLGLELPRALAGTPAEVDATQAESADTLVEELREIASSARAELAERKARLLELDPALASPFKAASRELREAMERLSQKVTRVRAAHGGRRARHRRGVLNGLRPRGRPQDEILGPFELVARHGTDWIEGVGAELDPFAGEHLAFHLGE